MKRLLTILISAAIMLYTLTGLAETLTDPTEPPATLSSAGATDTLVPTGPILQSIMLGPQIRAAIISGEQVLLGKKYHAATLIKLSEHEAVLRHPDMTTQTLSMDFGINKKNVMPSAGFRDEKPKTKPSTQSLLKPIEVSEK